MAYEDAHRENKAKRADNTMIRNNKTNMLRVYMYND